MDHFCPLMSLSIFARKKPL